MRRGIRVYAGRGIGSRINIGKITPAGAKLACVPHADNPVELLGTLNSD